MFILFVENKIERFCITPHKDPLVLVFVHIFGNGKSLKFGVGKTKLIFN